MSRRRIGLVACVGKKLKQSAPARELYISDLFKKSRAWVERNCDEWAILSAERGLVMPEEVIAPYDKTLNTMQSSAVSAWAEQVNGEIRKAWPVDEVDIVVLAGVKYRKALEGIVHEVPMRGLGIGKQLGWLKRQLAES